MRGSQMNDYVLQGGLWVPATRELLQRRRFELAQEMAAKVVADHRAQSLFPDSIFAGPAGLQSQIDKLQVGTSPRFTAIQANTLVRAGWGILVAVTLGIAAAAGGTVALFDGNGGAGATQISPTIDATKGPTTLWIYQAFGETINVTTQGLFITIAVAASDLNVITSGI